MANELVIKSQDDVVALANDFIRKNHIITSKNYNVENAMVSLFTNVLTVKDKNNKSVLDTCTPMSIQNAIYECITNELTPSRSQNYFIPYGNELKCQISYFGLMKQARDLRGVNIFGDVIRDGDAIDVENRIDGTKVVKHKTNITSILTDKAIIGAYAVASDITTGRVVDSDVMSMKEINKSASKSKTGGQVHKEFPHEMSVKTVIRRLAKKLINSSDDSRVYTITNPDGTVVTVNSYDDMLREDNYVDCSYTINTEEQITKEMEKFEPTDDDIMNAQELHLGGIDGPSAPEGAIEIDYNLVKGGTNKEHFKVIPNTYNKSSYTCMAIPLTEEALQMISK